MSGEVDNRYYGGNIWKNPRTYIEVGICFVGDGPERTFALIDFEHTFMACKFGDEEKGYRFWYNEAELREFLKDWEWIGHVSGNDQARMAGGGGGKQE